nr:RNA polymerase sigma-70 factor [Pedobacter panaciterrae]
MLHYDILSDCELVTLLKAGDDQAYAAIYDRYKVLMFRHACSKIYDTDDAQDILQDVFLSLWNKRADISESENLAGYIYTAIRNKTFNLIAHHKIRIRYEESMLHFAETGAITTDHLVREKQFSELIEREIAALPLKMRKIFILSRKGHLKNKDIAIKLDISEHTVATQIKRALKILKTRLGVIAYLSILFIK